MTVSDISTARTSRELATTQAQHSTASLSERMTYAKALADASLLPRAYRGRPADVLLAIETGDMLGLAPMAAISNVHIVEGKPTFSAGLMSALVRRAGHRLRVWCEGDDKAVAELIRADDPDFTYRSEWTFDRARQAGLTGKDVWKRYRANMLKSRATSEVCRDGCPDVFLGPVYVPEELGAEVDADGDPITPTQPQQDQPQAVQGRQDENVQDAEIVDEPTPAPAQPAQVVDADPTPSGEQNDADEGTGDMAYWENAIQHALEFPHAAHRREAFAELYNQAKVAYDQGTCPDAVVNRIIDLGAEAKRDMEETEQAENVA